MNSYAMLEKGDLDGAAVWRRIVTVIDVLQREKPKPGLVRTAVDGSDQIPPPIDIEHTEGLDDGKAVLFTMDTELLRNTMWHAALVWFGIIGGALTLVGNLGSLLTLTNWVQFLIDNWVAGVSWFWSNVLFFAPKLDTVDAITLTVFIFTLINLISSWPSEKQETRTIGPALFIPATVIMIVFAIYVHDNVNIFFDNSYQEILQESGANNSQSAGYVLYTIPTFTYFLAETIGLFPIPVESMIFDRFLWFVPLVSVIFAGLSIMIAVGVYIIIRSVLSLTFSGSALASRLWRIVIFVVILVALNYGSPYAEEWFTKLPAS